MILRVLFLAWLAASVGEPNVQETGKRQPQSATIMNHDIAATRRRGRMDLFLECSIVGPAAAGSKRNWRWVQLHQRQPPQAVSPRQAGLDEECDAGSHEEERAKLPPELDMSASAAPAAPAVWKLESPFWSLQSESFSPSPTVRLGEGFPNTPSNARLAVPGVTRHSPGSAV